jgi:hypothetical protein
VSPGDPRLLQEIDRFERVLAEALNGERPPVGLAVDLRDLMGTLERGVALLRALMESTGKETIAGRILAVELLVADELGMISQDVLPALRQVKNRAYADLEEEEPLDGSDPA